VTTGVLGVKDCSARFKASAEESASCRMESILLASEALTSGAFDSSEFAATMIDSGELATGKTQLRSP